MDATLKSPDPSQTDPLIYKADLARARFHAIHRMTWEIEVQTQELLRQVYANRAYWEAMEAGQQRLSP